MGGAGLPRRDASNETQALRCKGETQTHLRVGTAVTTEHSRNELTRRCGITSGQLSHLMNGKRSLSPMLRGRLQEKLGGRDFGQLFTIEWMDGHEEDPPSVAGERRQGPRPEPRFAQVVATGNGPLQRGKRYRPWAAGNYVTSRLTIKQPFDLAHSLDMGQAFR